MFHFTCGLQRRCPGPRTFPAESRVCFAQGDGMGPTHGTPPRAKLRLLDGSGAMISTLTCFQNRPGGTVIPEPQTMTSSRSGSLSTTWSGNPRLAALSWLISQEKANSICWWRPLAPSPRKDLQGMKALPCFACIFKLRGAGSKAWPWQRSCLPKARGWGLILEPLLLALRPDLRKGADCRSYW